jgi:hypothetical protein
LPSQCLAIFWGGLFLCVTTFHAAGANDDFRLAVVDLNWRKQEMVALASLAMGGAVVIVAQTPLIMFHS